MLERISFQLANNRGRYTHFIHCDGSVASLYPLETIHEARFGIMCEKEFPSEAQYDAAEELASFAVGINPHVIVMFDEGTSPFPARFPPDHPANAMLVTK
jgi:hypothetical protein